MTCYVHAVSGSEVSAVAICRNCGVGLCLEHVQNLQAHRPGGSELGCNHMMSPPKITGEADSSSGQG